MDYEYRVVPFLGDVASRDQQGSQRVAQQLQSLIDANTGNGWEFYRIDQVQIVVRPGCLAGLFGAQTSTIALDQVTFRRARSSASG